MVPIAWQQLTFNHLNINMVMDQDYETLVEAINGFKAKGYTYEFNVRSNCIECAELDLRLTPDNFEVVDTYRFEGISNPSDSSVLYAIESNSGIKGIMIDAYGLYAENMSMELAQKIRKSSSRRNH